MLQPLFGESRGALLIECAAATPTAIDLRRWRGKSMV
jgi:hypothetical protein